MYSQALNSVFNRRMFSAAVHGEAYPEFVRVGQAFVDGACDMTNGEVSRSLYALLEKYHRNEYVYKNTLLRRIVFGRHSPRTSTALTEFQVGGCIADFVVLNGKAVAYEIKTDLDNFDRLDRQLRSYYKVFDRVCIVCGEANAETLLRRYKSSPVGVCVLTRSGHVSTRKEDEVYQEGLSVSDLFRTLRKAEYAELLSTCGLDVPDVKPVFYYRSCLESLKGVDVGLLYQNYVATLKRRGADVDVNAMRAVPNELKFLGYFTRFRQRDVVGLASFLEAPFVGQGGL